MKNLNNLRKVESSINKNLFIVSCFVTIATMTLFVADFFSRGRFLPPHMNLFYLAVVLIYSLHKELLRWLGEKKIRRQGEYFVYIWIVFTTILYMVNFFSRDYYTYSEEGYKLGTLRDISIITMEVLAVFIVTRFLKLLEVIRKGKS